MKKLISFILLLAVIALCLPVYADALQNVTVNIDKSTVHPGEEVKVDVNFGQDMGSYTVDVAYDNNLLEYVSADGGTADDNGTRIRVYFFDSAGETNPRSTMSVVFKAKDVTTSNPTDFSITAEGLANPDASITYDDITTPIDKSVIVEPQYVDYNINLTYTGDVIVNEEKDMKLTISSSMGKNYEHTRILAETTTPDGATVKLLGTDEQQLEHDIIQSGWGDAAGDQIGGKDVSKELNLRGIFDKAGDYTLKIKLIDRDNSDAEIASKTFDINVKETQAVTPPEDNEENNEIENGTTGESGDNTTNGNNNETGNMDGTDNTNNEQPDTLPKTGSTVYLTGASIIAALAISYFTLKKDKKN